MPTEVIETIKGWTEGYGGPSKHWTKIVWNNLELEYFSMQDPYTLGRITVEAEYKWKLRLRDGSIAHHARKKPQAFEVCDECGHECRNNIIRQYTFKVCSEECCEKARYKYAVEHPCDHPQWAHVASSWPSLNTHRMHCASCGAMWTLWPEGKLQPKLAEVDYA